MKISQFPLIESVDGSEQLAIVKDGANGKMKTSAIIAKVKEGFVPQIAGKGLSTNDYTNADKTKLGALPTKNELDASIASKQPAITASDDIAPLGADKLALTDKAKLALFVNLWNAAWTTEGKYDPQNAPDSQHPFMGNGLWFTFAEALRIYDSWLKAGKSAMKGAYTSAIQTGRTVIPPLQSYNALDMSDCFNRNRNLEVFVTRMCVIGNLSGAFNGCTKLTTVKIHTLQFATSVKNCFAGCSSLTTVELTRLKLSISFADSPLLSLSSMQYLVDNAANTTPITITLHPDAHARLTEELIAQAAEKQITFATT